MSEPSPGWTKALLPVLTTVLAVEALAVAGVFALLLFAVFTAPAQSGLVSIALAVMVALAAIFVIALAVGCARRKRWIRGGAFTWQILQIPVAVTLMQGDLATWLGPLLLALSIAGLVAVAHPRTAAALVE